MISKNVVRRIGVPESKAQSSRKAPSTYPGNGCWPQTNPLFPSGGLGEGGEGQSLNIIAPWPFRSTEPIAAHWICLFRLRNVRILRAQLNAMGLATLMTEPSLTPEVTRAHGLTAGEYQRIKQILGREPIYTELGIFS